MSNIFGCLLTIFLLIFYAVSAKEDRSREGLEPYMRNVVRLISTVQEGQIKLISFDYNHNYRADKRMGYVFDEILGSIVHAGFKTREYYLNKTHPCVGLKKLYQRRIIVDEKAFGDTNLYNLSTNFLDTNNEGDRQPIGLCAAKKGDCGADIPLDQLYPLNKPHHVEPPLCFIWSPSEQQLKKEKTLKRKANFRYGNIKDKVVKVYAKYLETHTTYLLGSANYSQKLGYNLAFNLFKKEAANELKNHCVLLPIAQYINQKNETVIFHDPERDKSLRNGGYLPYPNESDYILGYGVQKYQSCGAKIKFEIRRKPGTGDVRAVMLGTPAGLFTERFHKGFFYTL